MFSFELGRQFIFFYFVAHSHTPLNDPTMQNSSNHDLNRQRFAMSSHGFSQPTSKLTMNKAIQMSCRHTDIISTTYNSEFAVSQAVDAATEISELRSTILVAELQRASVAAGFALLPIQSKAVGRIVRRPSSTMTITPTARSCQATVYRTPASDVLSPVIVDMPTGTGKTITAILGGVLFATERRVDMQQQFVVPPTIAGVSEVTGCVGYDPAAIPVSNKCMFFTPRHLVQHWVNHVEIAKKIVEGMTFSDGCKWTVRLETNRLASSVAAGLNEVVVIICDSSRCSMKKFLEPSVHYSTLCFDEAGERDAKVNALCQLVVPNIKHGRVILVSADFSKWRHYFDVRTTSFFRHIFPQWVRHGFNDATAAACRSAAVFARSERESVMRECTDALRTAVLDVASVGYRPSLVERVGGGYAVELGEDRGCDLFHRKYGVDVSACTTVGDICAAIAGQVEKYYAAWREEGVTHASQLRLSEKINKLEEVSNKIKGVLTEDCPICLSRKQDLTFIQPCLHFTCKGCLSQWTGSCPMCRGERTGTVGVAAAESRAKKQRTETRGPGVGDERIGSLFFDELAKLCGDSPPTGVMQAIQQTLMAVQNARALSPRAGGTLRTMLVCPGANMRDGLFANMGFDVLYYRVRGSKESPVTMKRMNAVMDKFKANDGRSKLLCVRDAGQECGQDTMTGLDIPNLDCVVSIGGLNLAQRMGRLCRLSRMALPEEQKHGLYVDIVPIFE